MVGIEPEQKMQNSIPFWIPFSKILRFNIRSCLGAVFDFGLLCVFPLVFNVEQEIRCQETDSWKFCQCLYFCEKTMKNHYSIHVHQHVSPAGIVDAFVVQMN